MKATRPIEKAPRTRRAPDMRPADATLRALIESVHDHAIFMVDAKGRIVSWSERAERLLGYSADEVVGASFALFYTEEDRARNVPKEELRQAKASGRAGRRRWHVRRDDSRFWGDGVLKAVRDETGRLRGFSKMIRDTTERWPAEEALRQTEDRFKIVARATNDAVWDWNLATNEVWWNESVTTLFGYSAKEIGRNSTVGRSATWWYKHIHPEDRARVVSSIYATIINREQEWTAEYRFERQNKSYADIYDRGFVVYDDKAKPVRMIGSMMDITERKRAERERLVLLERAEAARIEAEKANRVKDEFLAMVSHELRTPLTTIKMMTRLAQRGTTSEAERRECLDSIAAECDRQIDLVMNLLDVSRLEAGALDLRPTCVDVSELLNACAQIELHAAALRRHELSLDISNGTVPLRARADRKALRRVLCNLIENAIKYTPDGGCITLRAWTEAAQRKRASDEASAATAESDCSSKQEGDASAEVCISVIDTGRGIAPEDAAHIFERFYRGRAAAQSFIANELTTPPHIEMETPGVGLGLYLAQTIVKQLGGRITVESTVGCGSTFTLHLPAWCDQAEGDMNEGVKGEYDEAFAGR